MQEALIDLLCDKGADAESAAQAALVNGEFEAVNALVRRGVKTNLAIAAALDGPKTPLVCLRGRTMRIDIARSHLLHSLAMLRSSGC